MREKKKKKDNPTNHSRLTGSSHGLTALISFEGHHRINMDGLKQVIAM